MNPRDAAKKHVDSKDQTTADKRKDIPGETPQQRLAYWQAHRKFSESRDK